MESSPQPNHVFEGEPDARQLRQSQPSQAGKWPESLFRPRYRPLSAEEVALHDQIKAQADLLLTLFRQVTHAPAETTLAQRRLEEAVFWAVKALTSEKPQAQPAA